MSLRGLFVVGTDTGVGKTRVASGIARALSAVGHRVGVLKPVATGATREAGGWRCDDAERLIEAVGGGLKVEDVAPLLFEEPLAPPVAARRSGPSLPDDRVYEATFARVDGWDGRADVLVVEGVGGLLCPLGETSTVADLAVRLDFPLVVVARRGLGTLNHTLLTVEAARTRSLRIAGLVLNSPGPEPPGVAEATNAGELSRRLPGLPILAELLHEGTGEGAGSDPLGRVDWFERAAPPRVGTREGWTAHKSL